MSENESSLVASEVVLKWFRLGQVGLTACRSQGSISKRMKKNMFLLACLLKH